MKKSMFFRVVVLCTVALLSITVAASADIEYRYFDNDSGDQLWLTATNWTGDVLPTYSTPESDVYLGIDGSGQSVIVNSTGAQFWHLNIGFNDAAQVNIEAGGYLGIAGSTIYVGGNPYGSTDAYGVINVNGGIVHAETWSIAASASATTPGVSSSGTGIVNITNGGQMILGWWGSWLGTQGTAEINIVDGILTYWGGGLEIGSGAAIDICGTSSMNLNGDLTSLINPLIASGNITGDGVVGNAVANYNSETGWTNVTSLGPVPEPATMLLLAFGGSILLRRKH